MLQRLRLRRCVACSAPRSAACAAHLETRGACRQQARTSPSHGVQSGVECARLGYASALDPAGAALSLRADADSKVRLTPCRRRAAARAGLPARAPPCYECPCNAFWLSQDWYYWNSDTDETTWIKPSAQNMALPPGGRQCLTTPLASISFGTLQR